MNPLILREAIHLESKYRQVQRSVDDAAKSDEHFELQDQKMGAKRFGLTAIDESRLLVEIAKLSGIRTNKFDIRLNTEDRARLAEEAGVRLVAKLRFAGEIIAVPPGDWLLRAKLGATVVQPCVVTLNPVKTRMDSAVERRYSPIYATPAPGSCVPIPDNENLEPIKEEIDLWEIICESLVLVLPLYPRCPDVGMEESALWSEPDRQEFDKPEKPFAILSEFRKQLER